MAKNFLGNCLHRLCNAGVCMGGSAILLASALPIAQIALGAVYIDECPAAPAIPVYVMVSGIVALLLKLMLLGPKLICPTAPSNTVCTLSTLVVVLFAFVWFIFGSYHIYSIHPPNYTKIAMDPDSLNNGISTPTAPDNKTGLTSDNQNQSIPILNRTWMINKNDNNKTLMNLTEILSTGNISSQINLTETLASVNISNKRNLTETLASGNISNKRNMTETLASGNISNKRNMTETLASVNISNKRNLTETLASGNISIEANREHLNAPQTRRVVAARSYCQKTVYLFAFWTTTLVYVIVGHALVISICIFGFLKFAEILTKFTF